MRHLIRRTLNNVRDLMLHPLMSFLTQCLNQTRDHRAVMYKRQHLGDLPLFALRPYVSWNTLNRWVTYLKYSSKIQLFLEPQRFPQVQEKVQFQMD